MIVKTSSVYNLMRNYKKARKKYRKEDTQKRKEEERKEDTQGFSAPS